MRIRRLAVFAAVLILSATPSLAETRGFQALPSPRQLAGGLTQIGHACGRPVYRIRAWIKNATANRGPEGESILVTTGMLSEPKAVFRFVIAHECSHFQRGHLSMVAWVHTQAMARRMELEADCDAARNLQSEGDARAVDAFVRLLKTNPWPGDVDHPDAKARIANIQACRQG